MKQEQEFKLKSVEINSNALNSPAKSNVNRLQPKSLRGGGGTGKSFYFKDDPPPSSTPGLKSVESFFGKDDAFNDLLKDHTTTPPPGNFNAFSYGIASGPPPPGNDTPTTPRGSASMFSRLLGQK